MTAPSVTIPATVRLAVTLLWTLVGLAVVRTVYVITAHRSLIDAYVASQPAGLPRHLVEQSAPAYVPVTLAGALLFGLIVAVSALNIARGRRWARVLAVVFCALTAVGGLLVIAQPGTAIYRILGVLSALIAIAALVTLFQRPTNRHFATAR